MVSESVGVKKVAPFFPARAKELVFQSVQARLEPSDHHVDFSLDDVYVVSFRFILGHWKALVSTTLPDGMYYEVTHNSAKRETYLTSYKQWDHTTIPDETES